MYSPRATGTRSLDPDEEVSLSLRRNADADDENELDDTRNKLETVRYRQKVAPVSARDWDDAATAVTGVTSEFVYSEYEDSIYSTSGFCCARYGGPTVAAIVGIVSVLSPLLMVVLPKAGIVKWHVNECDIDCQSILIGLGVRLLLLVIATCVLFLRSPRATMPRVFVYRALIIFLLFVVTITFWLFYIFRIFGKHLLQLEQLQGDVDELLYQDIAGYAASFADVLMFIHYLAVIAVELRQLDVVFAVKITRSPDGTSETYSVGRFTIQRLAVWCLEQYYRDFQVYNPYLESLPHRVVSQHYDMKMYDIDGGLLADDDDPEQFARHRGVRLSERLAGESVYEKRVARRRARLLTAAEEAFGVIHRMNSKQQGSVMSSEEASQTIFATIERPLRKYLRITRQQPWHSRDSVVEHLALCLNHSLSARAFLEPFLVPNSVIWSDRDSTSSHIWTINSDDVVTRSISHGTQFELCQGDVILHVTVRQIPHILLRAASRLNNVFGLRIDSETSV